MSYIVASSETECPLGMVNDTAPGQCVLYNDKNLNSICDLSEPHNCTTETAINNPEGVELSGTQLKAMTVQQVAIAYGIDEEVFASELGKIINMKVSPKDSLKLLHDNNALGMANVKEIASRIASGKSVAPVTSASPAPKTKYYLLPIIIISTILYIYIHIHVV